MVGARYALAISRHPVEPALPQPHPHTRYLIDRTLCHFENQYREDISVVSRAEYYQLSATLDHIADRFPAVEDRVSITWESLGAWMIYMPFQAHSRGAGTLSGSTHNLNNSTSH
jgi:hypothetical protein